MVLVAGYVLWRCVSNDWEWINKSEYQFVKSQLAIKLIVYVTFHYHQQNH